MTWSDAELSKTLLDLTAKTQVVSALDNQRTGNKNVHVIVSLDFNKFNQKWRHQSTYKIFRTFDELFGTPGLYTYSHEFFESSFFYLSSNNCPPNHLVAKDKNELGSKKINPLVFDSETTWYRQAGGCEGLRQKGWTAIIGAMLAANEYETGLSSWIIGQGDNQVIVVAIPPPQSDLTPDETLRRFPGYISTQVGLYLENLEKLTKGIGMDLKLEESWVSTSLLNYGKEIIFSGSYASGSSKKISRAYQEISELYPTLQNRVASLFTSAQSCAMKGFDILAPYFLSLIEVLSLLDKETEYGTTLRGDLKDLLRKNKMQLDEMFKICSLFLPNECGGLPILPFPHFLYRGHPDQLMIHLIWLKHLGKTFVEAERILDLILLGFFHDSRVDHLHLIQDPQSVNFRRPTQSYNQLKTDLTEALKEKTKNPMIKLLLRACNEKTLRSQADYLMLTEPCFPRVLNEILRLSPDGSMLSFLATFTNMRTMKDLLHPQQAQNLINHLRQGDLLLFQTLIAIKKVIQNEEYKRFFQEKIAVPIEEYLIHWKTCSFKAAQEIRSSSWGVKIEGVSTPHPIEQGATYISDGDTCRKQGCTGEEFILFVAQSSSKKVGNLEEYYHRGSVRHYLGSGTSEKRSGPILQYPKK